MTGQAVILNKLGVALASNDTPGLANRDAGPRAFPGQPRIHPLPAPHAVAVLRCGPYNEIVGIPDSVLIGEWVRTLPDEPLDRVREYGEHFSAWLEERADLFSSEAQDGYFSWFLGDHFISVRNDLLAACEAQGLDPGAWGTRAGAEVVHDVFADWLDRLRPRPTIPGWQGMDIATVTGARAETIEGMREWIFDDTPRTRAGDAQLNEIVAELLRVYEPWAKDVKLLFAGFGAVEHFPAQQVVTYQGFMADRLRAVADEYNAVGVDEGAFVTTFGPYEMGSSFLRGHRPEFRMAAHHGIEADVAPGLSSDGGREKQRLAAHEGLDRNFDELAGEEYQRPLEETIATLPVPTIERTAESLVTLQTLHQLAHRQIDSVGGPVEVVTITRDGGVAREAH